MGIVYPGLLNYDKIVIIVIIYYYCINQLVNKSKIV